MKIDLKFSFLVLFIGLFIGISNVKAATTLDYSTLNSSSYAHFVNCVSADNCANWFSYTNNIGGAVPFWTTSSGVLSSANGSGVGLNISVSEGFVSGNYYTVSVLVGTVEDDYRITGNTSNSYKVRTNSVSNAYIGAHGTNVTISTLDSITLQYVDNGSVLLNLCTNCSLISYTFQANQTGTYFFGTMTTATSSTNHWDYYGYYYSDHGSKAPTTAEISSALQSQFNSINNNINSMENSINSNIDDMKDKQDETNQTLDEIKDMDISDEDKELPDDTQFNNYQDAENDLMDKVNEADMSVLDVAIDVDSSNFVWDTLTELIQSHTLIFSTIIAILSIGIIKLALGR